MHLFPARAAPRIAAAAAALATMLLPVGGARADNAIDTIARVKVSVVAVGTYERTRTPAFEFKGTGFAVGDGLSIITNAHVVPRLLEGAKIRPAALRNSSQVRAMFN